MNFSYWNKMIVNRRLQIIKLNKRNKKSMQLFFLLAIGFSIFPLSLTGYFLFGLFDLFRSKAVNWDMMLRYFGGNGCLTWALSPFNILLDLISRNNKDVYQLNDLPKAYQEEILSLLEDTRKNKEEIENIMCQKSTEFSRTMLFFKWYGENIQTSLNIPCFHKKYKYIKTIGISTFKPHTATSVHFGPLRITLRLLYNLSSSPDDEVYIQVGKTRHYWKNDAMFIFDDTFQHQSVNYSDQIRHCLFVDIIRPSKFFHVMSMVLFVVKYITKNINGVFYKRWILVK